ncbi:MAG: hypothetical protein JWR67_1965 [Mucilaginibacter sp.]|jgi:uncharacterized membrane protein YcaP (DUF421 family)|nr:hypothetical protein [Mucilaginibacter sp.]
MKKEEIHLGDIPRILFGQTPPVFLIEVFMRTVIIYIILLFVVKWMGKRMNGQLTIMELAVILTLGAIVSVPMQMPDRGILQGVILLVIAGLFQRGITLLGVRKGRMEDLIMGKCSLLVEDGILKLDQMEKDRITRQQVFEQLRTQKIFNLGKVDRVYLEACGIFSVLKAPQFRPGLPITPPDDGDIFDKQKPVFFEDKDDNQLQACCNCGYVKPAKDQSKCRICGDNEWVKAIG